MLNMASQPWYSKRNRTIWWIVNMRVASSTLLRPPMLYLKRRSSDMPSRVVARLDHPPSCCERAMMTATMHRAQKSVRGSLLGLPMLRIIDRPKSMDPSNSSHSPKMRPKVCQDAKTGAASMALVQTRIRRCLADSETRLDVKVRCISENKALDNPSSANLVRQPWGSSIAFELQKLGIPAMNRSSS